MIRAARSVAFAAVLLLIASPSGAQDAADDSVVKLSEPDFTLVNIPSALRLPPLKSAFRVTHRFVRPINCDDDQRCPESLLADLFGIDSGALTGLEFRIGLAQNLQIGIHRARSEKTIDLFGQVALLRQGSLAPIELSVRAGVEGTNNFRDEYSLTVALIAARMLGDRGAVYVEPVWIGNSNIFSQLGDDNTLMVALGSRLRISDTVYVVGEVIPRVAGYSPGTHQGSFAIEKRMGGHTFQLNFSNALGSTLGQAARAADNSHDWFMGFNISRKFF